MTAPSISVAPLGDAVAPCRGITPDMTDGALVRAALEGDDRAFTTLVDRHAPACLRFAKRMLGELADAEDAAQETFLRAFKALRTYDADTPFRTWLFAILVNRCRTSLLRRTRRERRVVRAETDVEYAASGDEARAFEFRDEIAWALAALPEEQREAFLLKHVEAELRRDGGGHRRRCLGAAHAREARLRPAAGPARREREKWDRCAMTIR